MGLSSLLLSYLRLFSRIVVCSSEAHTGGGQEPTTRGDHHQLIGPSDLHSRTEAACMRELKGSDEGPPPGSRVTIPPGAV
ncbi:MAG TPA: hypothetical protein VF043_02030 [Ktedonobacteraceae bacterium]